MGYCRGALVFMLALLGEEISPEAHAVGIGILFAARGLGTGIGPIQARNMFRNRSHWPGVLGACVAFSGIAYAAVGYFSWTYWIILFILLAHAASGANWVLATVMLQKRTEDRFRGRVFATEWLFVMLADTLSILTASLLLESSLLQLRTSFRVCGLVQIVCGLLWVLLIVPRERQLKKGYNLRK